MTSRAKWVSVIRYSSGFEADLAVNLLESEGISAHARGNDIVGIVGPGFQGSTSGGVDVMVLSPLLARARRVIERSQEFGRRHENG